MIKGCVWTVCLLSALTVGMKTLSSTGYVGGNVTFHCSDWDGFLFNDIKSYVRYFCIDPCKDKDVIMRVKPGETTHKDRISLSSSGGTLSVTFTDLQMSDTKTYYCGLDRAGYDIYIQVNLKVLHAVTPGPETTVRTVSVWSNPTVSTNSSDITSDISTLFTTLQATAAAASEAREGSYGSVLYLISGFTVVITTLMLLLCLMMKMIKERKRKASKCGSPEAVIQQETNYAEIRHEERTERAPAADVHTETLYANCSSHQDTEAAAQEGRDSHYASLKSTSSAQVRDTDSQCDCIYSVAQLPKEKSEHSECESAANDPGSATVYSIYSLVQPAQAT